MEKKVLSVTQLTSGIKALLEGGMGPVSVRGEISNYRPAASGHLYFSLKDADATIAACLFKGMASRIKGINVKDGLEVVCHGKLSVYPPRGSYQLIIEQMEAVGAGSLQAAFEALKKKLHTEGLFDPARKRPLPILPKRIVVITSPTGAAIRDVLSVLRRRFAGIKVLVIPALVQGEAAPAELIRALRTANEFALGDVILLTRGGGSLEDLWCFNNEQLAREIHASRIPVVSAVGHEIDFTIADFVADLRAATPSAAAEILVKEQSALLEKIFENRRALAHAMRSRIKHARLRLDALRAKLRNPQDRINELRVRFDDWSERLHAAIRRALSKKRERLLRLENSLQALSPLAVLDRGYSLSYDSDGKLIRSTKQAPVGSVLRVRVSDGEIQAQVQRSV